MLVIFLAVLLTSDTADADRTVAVTTSPTLPADALSADMVPDMPPVVGENDRPVKVGDPAVEKSCANAALRPPDADTLKLHPFVFEIVLDTNCLLALLATRVEAVKLLLVIPVPTNKLLAIPTPPWVTIVPVLVELESVFVGIFNWPLPFIRISSLLVVDDEPQ
jgi:hypothetical protein